MKRIMTRITAIASIVGLLLAMSLSSGRRPGGLPKVLAQEGCSVATLNGAYGFYRSGATPVGPLVAVGIATFDGMGTTTAVQTIRKNGVTTSDLFTDPPFVATYQVDPNCAGRFVNPDGSVFAHAVIVAGGNQLFIVSLSDSNTVYGVMKKINSQQD